MTTKPIKINGQEYQLADLSDAAKTMVRNIDIADQKIGALKQELALFQVAREAFGSALLASLPKPAEAAKPKAPAKKAAVSKAAH